MTEPSEDKWITFNGPKPSDDQLKIHAALGIPPLGQKRFTPGHADINEVVAYVPNYGNPGESWIGLKNLVTHQMTNTLLKLILSHTIPIPFQGVFNPDADLGKKYLQLVREITIAHLAEKSGREDYGTNMVGRGAIPQQDLVLKVHESISKGKDLTDVAPLYLYSLLKQKPQNENRKTESDSGEKRKSKNGFVNEVEAALRSES
jgi:hypothetical protein